MKAEINDKLNYLSHVENPERKVTITYFIPDTKKEGGEYVARTGTVRKVDSDKKIVVIDNEEISIEYITDIDGIIVNL